MPRIHLNDARNLEHLSLKDIIKEKKKKNDLFDDHTVMFKNKKSKWDYTRLDLADKKNARDLDMKIYDVYILVGQDTPTQVKSHVFKQALSSNETDGSGRLKRKREHINSFFISNASELREWARSSRRRPLRVQWHLLHRYKTVDQLISRIIQHF